MKPRTVAQLKKLIAEGLKKSPDGITRLDVSVAERNILKPTLEQYRMEGFHVEYSLVPKDTIDESLIKEFVVRSGKKPGGASDFGKWRVAVFPQKWKGFPVPLSEQIFHKGEEFEEFKDGGLSFVNRDDIAQADAAAAREKAKRPNAVISKKLVQINKNMKFGYAVRAWNPLDYLQVSFPAFTLAETVGILMELYERMEGNSVTRVYYSEKGTDKNKSDREKRYKIIRAKFLALRQDPRMSPILITKTGVMQTIEEQSKGKENFKLRTIIKACRDLK